MHFETSAVPAEMTPLFRRFVDITGWEVWKARLTAFSQQLNENPLIGQLFVERYPIELAMQRLHQRVRLGQKIGMPKSVNEYAVLSFIAMVARTHVRLSPVGKKRLAGMIRSGLKDEYGVASLRHEMIVAAHLMSRGFDVAFSDMEAGGGCDFIASKEEIELEVECKTHSADLGRKVHRRRLHQLGHRMQPSLSAALDRVAGVQLVEVTLPKRLDGNTAHLLAITECVEAALLKRAAVRCSQVCNIDYRSFALSGTPFEGGDPRMVDIKVVREHLEKRLDKYVGHALMIFSPQHGAVIATVESEQPDEVMNGVVRQLKQLVKDQLTGVRPALISVMFSDITADELIDMAEGDHRGEASTLQRATSMLLDREGWKKVHSVAYLAHGNLSVSRHVALGTRTTHLQENGPSYFFVNPHNEFASDSRLRVF